MKADVWFEEQVKELEDDPGFLTEQLLLDVTEQLYVRMEEAGLRSSDLAERLGVSRAYITQLFNGRPNMTMRTLVGVAHALDQRVRVTLRPRRAAHRSRAEFNRRVRGTMPEQTDVSVLAA
jgi:transcriptional regulator with XRE-family HTH domain